MAERDAAVDEVSSSRNLRFSVRRLARGVRLAANIRRCPAGRPQYKPPRLSLRRGVASSGVLLPHRRVPEHPIMANAHTPSTAIANANSSGMGSPAIGASIRSMPTQDGSFRSPSFYSVDEIEADKPFMVINVQSMGAGALL